MNGGRNRFETNGGFLFLFFFVVGVCVFSRMKGRTEEREGRTGEKYL